MRNKTVGFALVHITVVCLLFSLNTIAQAEEAQIHELKPGKVDGMKNGEFSAVQWTSSTVGDRYVVKGLDITNPVAVSVFLKEKGPLFSVTLSKEKGPALLKKENKGSEKIVLKTRTQGDLFILVKAAQEGIPYQLAVWVGDESEFTVPPSIVATKDYQALPIDLAGKAGTKSDSAESSQPNMILFVIAGLLTGIFVLLSIVFLRKKSR